MQLVTHRIGIAEPLTGIGLVSVKTLNYDTSPIKALQYSAIELCAAEYAQDLADRETDRLVDELRSIARNLLSIFPGGKFLVSSGGDPRPRNRVRTYKGTFGSKSILEHSNVIQEEIGVDGNLTMQVAVAEVHAGNLEETLSISWDFVRNCFALVQDGISNEAMLRHAVQSIDHTDGHIDFSILASHVCASGGFLLRLARSQRLSLTVIGKHDDESILLGLVEQARNHHGSG